MSLALCWRIPICLGLGWRVNWCDLRLNFHLFPLKAFRGPVYNIGMLYLHYVLACSIPLTKALVSLKKKCVFEYVCVHACVCMK